MLPGDAEPGGKYPKEQQHSASQQIDASSQCQNQPLEVAGGNVRVEEEKSSEYRQSNNREYKLPQSLWWNLCIIAERVTKCFPHHAEGNNVFDGHGNPIAVSIANCAVIRNSREDHFTQEVEHNRTVENGKFTRQITAQHDSHDQAFSNRAADPGDVIDRVKIRHEKGRRQG